MERPMPKDSPTEGARPSVSDDALNAILYGIVIGGVIGAQFIAVALDHPTAVWLWCKMLHLCVS